MMHAPAIQSHEAARLVACCGRNSQRTHEFAEKHNIPVTYTDYREMIDKELLDVIVISTPESSHHPICLAAAQEKIHVVCEKPLSMNSDLAREMVEAVELAGVKHMSYFTWRWAPWLRHAKQLVDDGALGRIYEANIRFAGDYARAGDGHWKWDSRHGTGILGDLGSHAIDLAHWLIGPITDVDARIQSFIARPSLPTPAGDAAVMIVGFANGGHALLQATAVEALGELGMEWKVELFGELGSIRITADFANGWRYWSAFDDDERDHTTISASLLEGIDEDADFGTQIGQLFTTQSVGTRLFIDSLLQDETVTPTLRDGYRAQRVMDAALESSATRRRVAIPEESATG